MWRVACELQITLIRASGNYKGRTQPVLLWAVVRSLDAPESPCDVVSSLQSAGVWSNKKALFLFRYPILTRSSLFALLLLTHIFCIGRNINYVVGILAKVCWGCFSSRRSQNRIFVTMYPAASRAVVGYLVDTFIDQLAFLHLTLGSL